MITNISIIGWNYKDSTFRFFEDFLDWARREDDIEDSCFVFSILLIWSIISISFIQKCLFIFYFMNCVNEITTMRR